METHDIPVFLGIYNSRNSIKLGNAVKIANRIVIYNSRNSIKLGNDYSRLLSAISTTVEILSSLETYNLRPAVVGIYNSRNSIKLGNP